MCLRHFGNRLLRRRRLSFGSVYARIVAALPADGHPATNRTRFAAAIERPDRAS
jgi:hypothetical protein